MVNYVLGAVFILLTSISIGLFFSCCDRSTFRLDIHSYKNAYRNHGLLPELDPSLEKLAECKLIHINVFYRHGTRSLSKMDFNNSLDLQKRLMNSKSSLLPNQLAKFSISPDQVMKLSDVGKDELYLMGQRMSKRYSGRIVGMESSFTEFNTLFRSSKKDRVLDSAAFFMKGLIPHKENYLSNREDIHIETDLIRFYNNCPKFQTSVLKNNSAIDEYNKFVQSHEVLRIIKEIRDKFDLQDVELSPDDLKTIYSLCGIDIANNPSLLSDHSAWCPLMTDDQRIVAEYMADIKRYYQYGYGYKITMLQSCRVLGRMIEDAKQAIADSKAPRGVFNFGHGEGLIPLIALLGLFNQSERPTAENFRRIIQLNDHSRFRMSRIATFGANVGFGVFACTGGDKNEGDVEYRVQPIMNEQSVRWNLCDSTHCSWQQFLNKFNFCLTPTFDFDNICSLN